MLRRTALLAVLIAASVSAQAGDRIVRGYCAAERCDHIEIVSALPYVKNGDGTLIQTTLRMIGSRAADVAEPQIENGYVFCSPTRPAIIAVKGNRTMAYLLAPLTPEQPPEVIRGEASQHAVYFGVCHGVEAGNAAATDPETVAARLGYRVSLLVPQQVTLRKPEDIMQPQGQLSNGGRHTRQPPRSIGQVEVHDLAPPRAAPSDGLTDVFDERLDRLLGAPGRQGPSVRPDAPYDGPFEDDAWLPPGR